MFYRMFKLGHSLYKRVSIFTIYTIYFYRAFKLYDINNLFYKVFKPDYSDNVFYRAFKLYDINNLFYKVFKPDHSDNVFLQGRSSFTI